MSDDPEGKGYTVSVRTRVVLRVQEWTCRLGAVLYAAPDARAARNGWTVVPRCGGLTRTYRDPRFDQFRRCHRCDGTGLSSRGSCFRCGGTGRLTTSLGRRPMQRAS
jgi:hypothetical protein